MAVCDLSGRNPNVLYELCIRQSFDLPVSLIKDEITARIFDIQGFRDVEYDSNLRIDEVNSAVEKLALNIRETYESKGDDVNSIVELLGISKAKVSKETEVSSDTALILKSLTDISSRLTSIEAQAAPLLVVDDWDPFGSKKEIRSFEHGGTTYELLDLIEHE